MNIKITNKSDPDQIYWNQETLPPGSEQDAVIKGITGAISNKGFVVAKLDQLINWGRTGSLWPMTFGSYGGCTNGIAQTGRCHACGWYGNE